MNKTKIRFWRGQKGMGILISITNGLDRIILDFGAPFEPLNNIYDGVIRPRFVNRVKDGLLLKKILPLPGIYDLADLKDLPVLSYQECDLNTAVFISHLHLDHMSEIDKLSEEIPVYIHTDGIELYHALNHLEKKTADNLLIPFDYHEEIKIGNITVIPFFSDHPCPGSAGFLIRCEDTTIFYSGDIRFHGLNHEKAFTEIEKVAEEKIDLLIVDATTVSPQEFYLDPSVYSEPSKEIPQGCLSEYDIYNDIISTLTLKRHLGIFNQYIRDVDMMVRMMAVAKKLNRTIVFEPDFAYVLKKVRKLTVPIRLYGNEDPQIMSELRNNPVVNARLIKDTPSSWLLQNSYPEIMGLGDFEGIRGDYYHLFGEPLVPEEDDYQLMLKILEKLDFSFHSYANLYSFSHSYPNQLAYVIKTINASSVVAVHSKKPENLNPVNSIQFFPDEEKEYVISDGLLSES